MDFDFPAPYDEEVPRRIGEARRHPQVRGGDGPHLCGAALLRRKVPGNRSPSILLIAEGWDTPIRILLPGEGRRLERDWFGRLQVSDVRGDVNTPAVSLQEHAEVRKVQELHTENAARSVGVEIHARGQLHRARRPALRDLAPEVDVQGVRFFVVFESHSLCAPFLTVRTPRPTRCGSLPLWLQCT